MYFSIIGYYVNKKTQEAVYDGGLWMVYEADDVNAVEKDFVEVALDLLGNYGDAKDIEFKVDVIQPMTQPPKMWKDRVITKLGVDNA